MFKSLSVKLMLGITGIVAAVLLVALIWDFQYQQGQVQKDMQTRADLVAKQTEAVRSFIAKGTGGKSPHDAFTPADVNQGISREFSDLSHSQVKQTRLVVRNGTNAPDEFERAALLEFEADASMKFYAGITTGADGQTVYRYVTPLRAQESCLRCHGEPKGELDPTGHPKEGMKVGDLAGAISVTLPMNEVLQSARTQSIKMAAAVLVLAALSLCLMWFVLWRQVAMPLRKLAGVATAVGSGQLEVRDEDLKELYANRETAVVADAVGEMSRRLRELYQGLERKVTERTSELQTAYKELERSSRMKSEFLTMVSHEFRTPLTSIITFTELLLQDAAGQATPEQREYLNDVLESSQKLLCMINNLLDMSRLEAGGVKLFREVVDPADLIHSAESTIRPLAQKQGLTLQVDLEPHLPLLHVDSLRVNQVLLNLLSNAVKFTPEGGKIRVSARQAGPWVEIAVADTGVGIAEEDQARIFEPFSQSGPQRPEGWGLGLALAKSLVELHGGQIWLESAPGKGSTFRFTLPRWLEEEGDQHVSDGETDPGGG